MAVSEETNQIAKEIVDAAYKVHTGLGPGLLESVYEVCLGYELTKKNLKFKSQVILPVIYDDVKLDAGFRLDLLVEDQIIVELKAIEQLLPIHNAQLLTYLKLSKIKLGLLINFNVPLIKNGIRRLIN